MIIRLRLQSLKLSRVCFAHESHLEWYSTVPVQQQISIKIDKDVLEVVKA